MGKMSRIDRVLLGFETGAVSERPSNAEPHSFSKMQVAALCASHDLAVVPSHGSKDGQCTCNDANCKHPGRHPRTEHGLRDATTDQTLIKKLWSR